MQFSFFPLFTPLESPVRKGGDEIKLPFIANTGFTNKLILKNDFFERLFPVDYKNFSLHRNFLLFHSVIISNKYSKGKFNESEKMSFFSVN